MGLLSSGMCANGCLLILFKGVNEFEARWIGWAGVDVTDEIGQRSLTEALAEKVCKIGPMLNS